MSKKNLNPEAVVNELKGRSVFFQDARPKKAKEIVVEEQKPVTEQPPRNQDTVKPRNRDTVVSRYHDTIIEAIRKAVKDFGKEAATHRFTVEEKRALAQIIFDYGQKGVKTSENEITRIAVNFVVNDYQKKGEESLLEKALRALNE